MASYLFIIQGEGKGHMSQALAMKEYLVEAGHTIDAVLLGIRTSGSVPAYFRDGFQGILKTFRSPFFLRTPNSKGIYVGRTILFNLLRAFVYTREIRRIRKEIDTIRPDVIINFYEMLGALAMRNLDPAIKRIGVGHHFYLSLNTALCKEGPGWHRWLLERHTNLIRKSCDRVLALSYREEQGSSDIRVVPPLVRREFREMTYVPGKRYLVYLLSEGYFYDLLELARSVPRFEADVFTTLNPGIELPQGITLHPFDAKKFSNLMASCRGLISTAGFDAAAEAAYHGIPLAVIPAQNHYEQKCNGADITTKGIGVAVKQINRVCLEKMKPYGNRAYKKWVDLAGEQIIKCIEE
jgi:uncharacterized protein (TIGR00661 family)